jgi:3',5'-nucleoside bisphosphate phosphatase
VAEINREIMKRFILKNRSLVKTISWRIIASLLTIAIIYGLSKDMLAAVSIVGVEFFTKMLLYWAHEKGWNFINKPEKGSKLRSLIKTASWRVVASIDTLFLVLLVTKEPVWAGSAALIESLAKTIGYYLHERAWNLSYKLTVKLDLHTHTTSSDGTYTPHELIAHAIEKECEYISITDHDNYEHVSHLGDIPENIKYITGVEISAEFKGTLHILGYGFDPDHAELRDTLRSLQDARRKRNESMLIKMAKEGFHISMEELIEESKGGMVGRPHFANLMLAKGYVKTYQEAFDKYLAKGQPLYMDKQRLEPKEAIHLILAAGGIPVMAHPYQTKLSGKALEDIIAELKSYGLQGIEAYYSQHTKEQVKEYLEYAKTYDLLITAGSDFHGGIKPNIDLGMNVDRIHLLPFLEAIKK